MIVKIQKPVIPWNGPFLIYDEKRTFSSQLYPNRLPRAVKKSLRKKWKAYFRAEIQGNTLALFEEVPPQPW